MRLRGAGVVGVLTMLLAVAPASAEVLGEAGGLIYVKQQQVIPQGPGVQSAETIAECPNGTAHTGGGATVSGNPTGTAISSSGPASGEEWDASGWHTGVNPTDETLTAWLVCTEKVGKISEEVEIVEVFDAPGGESGTPLCVNGHATGGGVRIPGPIADWWLNSTGAVDTGDVDQNTDDGWATWVHHLAGSGADIIMSVVCMEGKEPVYRRKTKETSDVEKVAKKVYCPKGTSATGGGAFASGGTPDSHITSTAPIDSKKDDDKVPDDGWKAKFFNDNGVDQAFTASVVCR